MNFARKIYLGISDVVCGHGFWYSLQGAPHTSGHRRPARFTASICSSGFSTAARPLRLKFHIIWLLRINWLSKKITALPKLCLFKENREESHEKCYFSIILWIFINFHQIKTPIIKHRSKLIELLFLYQLLVNYNFTILRKIKSIINIIILVLKNVINNIGFFLKQEFIRQVDVLASTCAFFSFFLFTEELEFIRDSSFVLCGRCCILFLY